MSNNYDYFDIIIPWIISHEVICDKDGHIIVYNSNIHNDNGGFTQWGISYRFLNDIYTHFPLIFKQYELPFHDLNHENMSKISYSKALNIYKTSFYYPYFLDHIIDVQKQAKIMDLIVNLPSFMAISLIQQTYNECSKSLKIKIDGILGNITLAAINVAELPCFKEKLIKNLKLYYRKIVSKAESQSKFLNNWIHRAETWPSSLEEMIIFNKNWNDKNTKLLKFEYE